MREIMRRAQSRGRACAGAVLIAALATGAVFAGLATGASTPAFAQSSKSSGAKSLSRKDASELVKKAQQAVAAKKPKRALSDLDRAIASGKLRYKDMAQALYQRGLAHRLAGNTPKAIEDLTAAVWIRNGLGADDRKAALAARTEAYAQAGLTSSPGVARAPASSVTPPRATASRPATTTSPARRPAARTTAQPSTNTSAARTASAGWSTEVTPKSGTAASQTTTDPLTQVGSGIQNFFGNLFSGVTAPGTAPTTASINRPARPAATSGWNSTTTTATAKTNSTSLKPVRVQVAAVRGQTEAKAIATRVNSQLKGALPGQSADVRRVNVGNMGALYRVEIGPFASERESRPACAALRKAGYDCLVLR